MNRYSEVYVSPKGLGEIVVYRSPSEQRARLFRQQLGRNRVLGEIPGVRSVITTRTRPTGILESIEL